MNTDLGLLQSANYIVSDCVRDIPKLIRGIMQNDEVDYNTAFSHRLVQRNIDTVNYLTEIYIPELKIYDC